jgi:hypothetical protein
MICRGDHALKTMPFTVSKNVSKGAGAVLVLVGAV